jgi:hypothetical protein
MLGVGDYSAFLCLTMQATPRLCHLSPAGGTLTTEMACSGLPVTFHRNPPRGSEVKMLGVHVTMCVPPGSAYCLFFTSRLDSRDPTVTSGMGRVTSLTAHLRQH